MRILHTQEEAQAVVAENEREQSDDKRWRQLSIDEALKRGLLSRHTEQTWMEQRQFIGKGSTTRAMAIARSFGRECPKFGDFGETSRICVRLPTRVCATCVSTAL
jgi:hypothetical protein